MIDTAAQGPIVLDGTKIDWYADRVERWARGERIAPVTIDMALTRACNYACEYCYAMLQENARHRITNEVMNGFLDDCAEIGVRGISLVSDGESTISPAFVFTVQKAAAVGLSIAVGTNGFVLHGGKLDAVLPHLTYCRINISAGEPKRYAEIMGVDEQAFFRVCQNLEEMVRLKRERSLSVTIGLQMVLQPKYRDQILPLASLGQRLGVDYLVIKHCSDDEDRSLGVDYGGYSDLFDLLRQAEALSTSSYLVKVKWSKIEAEGKRRYQRCYGAPFMLQLSGSGLVAPCGMLFNERYKKFHIGNITEQRFKDIWSSDRYWEVMSHLASTDFDAQRMCGSLCLQHKVNERLDAYVKGRLPILQPNAPTPQHLAFL